MNKFQLALILLFVMGHLYAQTDVEEYDAIQFSLNGHNYITEDGDYVAAEKEFAKIHKSDSLYIEALHNRVVCLRQSGEFAEALRLVDEGLELNEDYLPGFYINQAYCLDSLGQYSDAIKAIEIAEKRFPYNYNFKLAKGNIYQSMGEYQEAVQIFQNCILDEPLNYQNHLNLAVLYMKGNGITHVVLPVVTAILLNPEGESNLALLQSLESLVTSKHYTTEAKFDLYENNGDFSDLDDLVTNYIALSDDYKVPTKFTYGLAKQLYLILSEADDSQEDFITQEYITKLKPYVSDNYDALAGLMSISSTNENFVKLLEKNMDKIVEVSEEINLKFSTPAVSRAQYPGIDNAGFIYSDVGRVEGIAEMDKTYSKAIGPVVYFGDVGSVAAEGFYDKNGEQTGDWVWYNNNGSIYRTSYFKDGKLEGITKVYNDQGGTLLRQLNFKDGKLNGQSDNYKLIGYKYQSANYKDDQIHGEELGYYPDGTINYRYNYEMGTLQGKGESYYDDGSLMFKCTYKDGELDGQAIAYYRGGQEKYIENYSEGELNGEITYYHINGNISDNGSFKKGNRIGNWVEYNVRGQLISEIEYDDRGKKNGLSKIYNSSGLLENEYVLQKGVIKKITNYDKEGKVLSSYDQNKNDILQYVMTRNDGSKISEGKIVDSKKEGSFKYYNKYGLVYLEENYINDTLTGDVINYFMNGTISDKFEYQNGKIDGTVVEYFADGTLYMQSTYRNGELHGLQTTYNHDGTLYNKRFYYNGMLDGEAVYYNPYNTPYLIEEYDLGYLVNAIHPDTTGQISNTTVLERGKGVVEYDFELGGDPMGSDAYDGGEANGPQMRYYKNGSIRRESYYVGGVYHGDFNTYHHDGHKLIEGKYDHGLKVGQWKNYFIDGSLRIQYSYESDMLHGPYTVYYPTGEKYMDIDYEYNFVKDNYTTYSVDGSIAFLTYIEDGVLIGFSYLNSDGSNHEMIKVGEGRHEIKTFYSNGNESMISTYVNGALEGDYTMYYSDGTIYQKEFYKNGFKQGLQQQFYPNGNLYYEANYVYGIQEGLEKYYHENGKLKLQINYVVDEKHGAAYEYDADGELLRKLNYFGNVLYDKL